MSTSIAVTAALLALLLRIQPAGACSTEAASAVSTGTAVTIDGPHVTFHSEGRPKHAAPGIVSGGRVTVDYSAGSNRYIHIGDRYLVYAFAVHGEYDSFVQGLHVCGGPGTTHADGTAIDTTGRLLGVPTTAWLIIGLPVVVFASLVALGWRRGTR